MRHRISIEHALKILGILVVGLVLYHTWIKRALFTPPSPVLQDTLPALPSPGLTTLDRKDQRTDFVPRNRLIEPGPAPFRTLETLRHELDLGNIQQVEPALRTMSQRLRTKTNIRRYLAALWNNLGIQQEGFGGARLSVQAFQEAVKLDPKNPTALLNLTQAYWELRHPSLTTRFLETVIHAIPEDPFPHLALADLLLDQNHAASAIAHLEEAKRWTKNDPSMPEYLNKLMAKAEANLPRTPEVVPLSALPKTLNTKLSEPNPPPKDTTAVVAPPPTSPEPEASAGAAKAPSPLPTVRKLTRFSVRFEGSPDQLAWTHIRAILDYALDEIGQKFGHVPTKPISVVLHADQKFSGPADFPAWADTLFDNTSGTIHIPVQGAFDDLALFSRVVRHEFVHALLFEYLRGQHDTVPRWLREGLVIQLAEDPWPGVEQAEETATPQTMLPALQKDWKQIPPDSLPVAYLAAHSITQSFIDHYSMYSLRHVIQLVSAGHTLNEAMNRKLSVSYETFQREWQEAYSPSNQGG